MTFNQSEARNFRFQFASALHEHWKLYLFEGIVLIILGAAAIIIPQIATLTVELFIGWLLLFSGIVNLFTTFSVRPMPGFWWSLISALIAIAAGLVLLFWPISGMVSLTLVLIAFFIIEGISSIMFAAEHRNELPGSWWVMLLSGIVDLVLVSDLLCPAVIRGLGDRPACRHQSRIWRMRVVRDGVAGS